MSDRWLSSALFVVALTTTAFLVSRIYLLVIRRELQVRGVVYSRADTPIWYWALLVLLILVTPVTLALAVAAAMGVVLSFRT